MKFFLESLGLKRTFTLVLLISVSTLTSAQINISKDKKYTNKIVELYKKNHFSGVRLCKIKRHDFLVCAIEIPKNLSSDLDRIAFVKAQSAVNEFLNGSNVNNITTTVLEEKTYSTLSSTDSSMNTSANKQYTLNMIDKINTNSAGFVKGIESVYSTEIENHQKKVFFFIKEIF